MSGTRWALEIQEWTADSAPCCLRAENQEGVQTSFGGLNALPSSCSGVSLPFWIHSTWKLFWLVETLCLHREVDELVCQCVCVCSVDQSCLSFCNPMDCSPPSFSVHGIFQTRILEQVAISSSKGIFPTQELNPHLLHCQADSLPLSHLGSSMNGLTCEWTEKCIFRLSVSSSFLPLGSKMPVGSVQPAWFLCCLFGIHLYGREVCSSLGLSLSPWVGAQFWGSAMQPS